MQCNSNKDSRKGRVVYIKSFGCQMNSRDSEVISGLLVKAGYALAEREEDADVVIFNTCSVRQHAEEKVWSAIGAIVSRYGKSLRISHTESSKSKSLSPQISRTEPSKSKSLSPQISQTEPSKSKSLSPQISQTESSKSKSLSPQISRTESSKSQRGDSQRPLIGVVGCMANCYREAIFERAPAVDFIVGTRDIEKIPQILSRLLPPEPRAMRHELSAMSYELFQRKVYELDTVERADEIYHTGFHLDATHAFVNISHGCENFCSYCVVPYTRGKLVHRGAAGIIREIEEDIAAGITKITLLGQNVNQWRGELGVRSWESGGETKKLGGGSWEDGGVPPAAGSRRIEDLYALGVGNQDSGVGSGELEKVNISCPFELRAPNSELSFPGLLRLVNEIPGLKEYSFITSHPRDASVELFEAMRDCGKLKKYLHLPLQSASDRILKLMNRGYTMGHYSDIIKKYREIVPGGELTTDIIVGFPTETEEDFLATVTAIKQTRFDKAYIFKYSPRPHTQASSMPDDVSKEEKERRHKIVLDLQRAVSKSKRKPI